MEQTSGISLVPPESRKLNKATIFMACVTVLAIAAAATFGILWATKETPPPSPSQPAPEDCNSKDAKDCTNATTASADYIYIGQWGIKIKIPENLKNLKYTFEDARVHESSHSGIGAGAVSTIETYAHIIVNGSDGTGDNTIPAFVSDGQLSSVSRVAAGEYKCESSCPTYVTTIDGYEYYYNHPQTIVSKDSAETDWEMSSIQLIQDMLTNANNYSNF